MSSSPSTSHPAALAPKPRIRSPKTCRVGGGWYPGSGPHHAGEAVPRLRLRGRWLEALGFEVGARLRIIRSEGAITLQVIKD